MEMIEFERTKAKNMLYEFNQIAKNMYDKYTYSNFVAMPLSSSSVKVPELFSNSILVSKEIDLPFVNNTVVDPVVLNVAIKDSKACWYRKQDGYNYILSKDTDYCVSRDLMERELTEIRDLRPMLDINSYQNQYSLNDQEISRLINYEVMEFNIGSDNGNDIKFITTVKLFPAIKKANNILIYSKSYNKEENIYAVLICSLGDKWSLYTIHFILNFWR